MIFNKRVFVYNKVLKNDAIHNSLFRFQNINLNNVNDIYFAINIIVIVTRTLFETFIIIIFILKLIIVIIIIVIEIFVVIILEKFVLKFIVFDFNIKRRLIMSASFDKS